MAGTDFATRTLHKEVTKGVWRFGQVRNGQISMKGFEKLKKKLNV